MSDDVKVAAGTTDERRGWLTRSVIAGIVSGSIVLIFVRPFLSFLWQFVLSRISSISDSACEAAALDYTDAYSFTSEVRIAALLVGFACGIMVYSYARAARPEKSTYPFEAVPHIQRRLVTSRLAASLWFVFVTLTLTYIGAKQYLTMQMKASFHQRLAVLAPKISEQEHKEHLAAWANMRTQEDYRRIVTTMEAAGQRAGVSLPKLLPGATP
jgi:hypothetical protein